MKEELAKELLDVVRGTKESVIKGMQLASEQFPDLVEEILRFKLATAALEIIVALIFILGSVWTIIKAMKAHKKDEDADLPKIITLVAGVFGFITFAFLLEGVWNTLKITLAPKIFLIEYLSSLL